MTTAYNAISAYVTITKNATAWVKMAATNNTVINSINNVSIPTTNCTLIAGPEGESGTALQFNGTSSFIKTNITLPKNQFCIRVRFKTSSTKTGQLLSIGRVGSITEINGYSIALNASGKCMVYSWQNNASAVVTVTTTKSYNNNVWHELLLSKDENNQTTLYINGEIVGEFNRGINYLTTSIFTIGKLDVVGYESWFSGGLADFQVYPHALTPNDFNIKASMMLHNNEYKVYDGVNWISYGSTRPTISEFINNGMKDISILNRMNSISPIDVLTPKADLITWSPTPVQRVQVFKQIPPETITQRNDVDISPLESVNRFTVNANEATFAISIDSGVTWKAFSNGAWETITDFADGMTPEIMNGLSSEEIMLLLNDAKTIRFAIHLLGASSIVTMLRMTTNLKGAYSVVPTSDYSFVYNRDQANITFTVKRPGKFVVNYVDAL